MGYAMANSGAHISSWKLVNLKKKKKDFLKKQKENPIYQKASTYFYLLIIYWLIKTLNIASE